MRLSQAFTPDARIRLLALAQAGEWRAGEVGVGEALEVLRPGGATGYLLQVTREILLGSVGWADLPAHEPLSAPWPGRRCAVPLAGGSELRLAAGLLESGDVRVVEQGGVPLCVRQDRLFRWLLGELEEALDVLE